jgi:hypothetical protein
MPPIVAFVLGVLCSEAVQWALWGTGHPGRRALDYFADGWAHFVLAWGVCTMVGVAWSLEGLTALMSLLPDGLLGDYWKAGVPYSPQVGLLLRFGINAMADTVAFAFRARFSPAPATTGGATS